MQKMANMMRTLSQTLPTVRPISDAIFSVTLQYAVSDFTA